MILRLESTGADYQILAARPGGRRQIFTADPNNILLELNVFGD